MQLLRVFNFKLVVSFQPKFITSFYIRTALHSRSNMSTKKYFGAIDQGTSSSRFLLFDTDAKLFKSHQVLITTESPHPGWGQQCPNEMINSVKKCIKEVQRSCNIETTDILSIGITNQRETTVLWDSITGDPLCPALVWFDTRTQSLVQKYLDKATVESLNRFRVKTGLPFSTYFSVFKLKWCIENYEAVNNAYKEKRLKFGTVDSWLLYKLAHGHPHLTDVTNASRTLLFNINTLHWDDELCEFFEIDKDCLPSVNSCTGHFGYMKGTPWENVMGDQHAALFGQKCLVPGSVKNTYGTGCFLLMNTGKTSIISKHGLLTTLAFQLGQNTPPLYALEGSIAMGGKIFDFLKNNLNMIPGDQSIDELAEKVEDSGGVIFLPTLNGILAPFWRSNITGSISGLTLNTTIFHIYRAAVEALCFQTRLVLEIMQLDLGKNITHLKVDGGVTNSKNIMQAQADLSGMNIEKFEFVEVTALGVALAAGYGVGYWDSIEKIPLCPTKPQIIAPKLVKDKSDHLYMLWKKKLEEELKLY